MIRRNNSLLAKSGEQKKCMLPNSGDQKRKVEMYMLKLVWIPKHLKNFSFKGFHDELVEKMKDVEQQQEANKIIYADLLIAMNNVADLPEEKAENNIKVIVEFMEKELGL